MLKELDWEFVLTYADCNMNLEQTGHRMFMSRNGVVYRLEKVKDETGYDPRVFYDLMELVQIAKARTMLTVTLEFPVAVGGEQEVKDKLAKILSKELRGETNVQEERPVSACAVCSTDATGKVCAG